MPRRSTPRASCTICPTFSSSVSCEVRSAARSWIERERLRNRAEVSVIIFWSRPGCRFGRVSGDGIAQFMVKRESQLFPQLRKQFRAGLNARIAPIIPILTELFRPDRPIPVDVAERFDRGLLADERKKRFEPPIPRFTRGLY